MYLTVSLSACLCGGNGTAQYAVCLVGGEAGNIGRSVFIGHSADLAAESNRLIGGGGVIAVDILLIDINIIICYVRLPNCIVRSGSGGGESAEIGDDVSLGRRGGRCPALEDVAVSGGGRRSGYRAVKCNGNRSACVSAVIVVENNIILVGDEAAGEGNICRFNCNAFYLYTVEIPTIESVTFL